MTAEAWEHLVAVALVGTERKPTSPETLHRVGALVGAELGDDEGSVLTAAGVLGAYRRAGLLAGRSDGDIPEPAEDDPRPEASPAATQLLELLLEGHVKVPGGPSAFVVEWLDRCVASGRRAPARLLPALLDHGSRSHALRPAVVAAGGARLGWLAGHNPAWSWAVPATRTADDREVWRTGDHAARMERLQAVRRADPAAAIELVRESWAGEKARDRAEILEILRDDLGPADEAFLEEALDDRAPTVRATAADLLASLPGSALAQRMTERVRGLLDGHELALPDDLDAAARRDGIRDEGAPPGVGRRTWWLVQLVGATPLELWTAELRVSPADALRDQPELWDGWAIAARRQRDADWTRELVKDRPEPALLRVLPPADAWPAARAALPNCTDGAVPGVLAATAGPWPRSLTIAAVARLRQVKNSVAVEQGLAVVAGSGDAAVADELERWLGDLGPHDRLRHVVRAVLHALSIRQTIAQELP